MSPEGSYTDMEGRLGLCDNEISVAKAPGRVFVARLVFYACLSKFWRVRGQRGLCF